MSDSTSFKDSIKPSTPEVLAERAKLGEIDQSVRLPAIVFGVASVFWLMVGTLFALIASFKMHSPDFLGQWEWLTFGRVRTAHLNTVIFGWSTCAGIAVAIWLMARLSRTKVRHGGILIIAAVFWNIGLIAGVFGIFAGHMNSIEWLEIPSYATPILFFSYALIGVWVVITFRFRQTKHIYVSQWYLLAALFWFPWLYGIAQIMLVFEPARGTVQALVNWWFAHNVLGLWFTPIGLAAVYYFIPKVLGKPIHSYYLSLVAFWSLALFYNWAGVHHLIGGPVPAWVISAGIVASVMMAFPVIIVAINHHVTMVGNFHVLLYSPTLRFTVFAAMSYTAVSLQGSTMALRSLNEITHFTHYTVGHAHWGMYAWFTMAMFGAFYYIMPRLLQREWPSATLIRVHFWACAIGIGMYITGLSIGGWIQGLQMNNPDQYPDFIQIVQNTIPWLVSRSIAGMLILVGHVAFAINFFWILLQPRVADETRPTLFKDPEPMKLAAK